MFILFSFKIKNKQRITFRKKNILKLIEKWLDFHMKVFAYSKVS